jgi:hypothetical protein
MERRKELKTYVPVDRKFLVVLWNFRPHHVQNPGVRYWQAMPMEEWHKAAKVFVLRNSLNASLVKRNYKATRSRKRVIVVDVGMTHRMVFQAFLKLSKFSISQCVINKLQYWLALIDGPDKKLFISLQVCLEQRPIVKSNMSQFHAAEQGDLWMRSDNVRRGLRNEDHWGL